MDNASRDPFMGILMLDTAFPRYPGDIGNPDSFGFAVRHRIVTGAHPHGIVKGDAAPWLAPFVEAAWELEAGGARLLTTSCGFLAPFQQALAGAVAIPVLTSSLFLYHELAAMLNGGKRPGILTISADSLSLRHLSAAGIPSDAIVHGMPGECHFRTAILENRPQLDRGIAAVEVIDAARAMQGKHPDLGAILLECTNMPPYAGQIREATGLPVVSILDGLNALWHREAVDRK